MMWMNGDVLIDDDLFVRFATGRSRTALLIDNTATADDGTAMAVVRGGRVVDFGHHVRPEEASGKSMQTARFTAADAALLFDRMGALIDAGRVDLFPSHAYGAVIERGFVAAEFSDGAPWSELDTPEDYGLLRIG